MKMDMKVIWAVPIIVSILILGTLGVQVFAPLNPDFVGEPLLDPGNVEAPIPDWVDQNFRWYGQGQITQTELLNALTYLLDNSIMFISEKAAQEVADLRED